MEVTWKRACDGASACVEVARCDSGDCVEVGERDGMVGLRDSKNPDGPQLWFTRDEWDAFCAGVRAGKFDVEG